LLKADKNAARLYIQGKGYATYQDKTIPDEDKNALNEILKELREIRQMLSNSDVTK